MYLLLTKRRMRPLMTHGSGCRNRGQRFVTFNESEEDDRPGVKSSSSPFLSMPVFPRETKRRVAIALVAIALYLSEVLPARNGDQSARRPDPLRRRTADATDAALAVVNMIADV